MRNNDWVERKAVNCIEDIFLQNNLEYQLETNDKTEHIDGYVYVENKIGQLLGINIGKIELQVKGRTNSKKAVFKKGFMEYCKFNIAPVVVILVNIDLDKNVEGIYYKYIDNNMPKDSEKESYTITFNEEDRVITETIIKQLRNIQSRHWNGVIRNLSNVNTQIGNKEMYAFANSVIRSVNGFIYTTLKRYMELELDNLARFAIVYCSDALNGISYSIIPIFKDNICGDIIEVSDTKSIKSLGITRISSTGIDFTIEYINKFIINILKETIIPSIIDDKLFCKFNKKMAIRSLTYHFNNLLTLEKEKLSCGVKEKYIAEYDEGIKSIILDRSNKFEKKIISSIVDSNIKFIENKLKKDLDFYQQHFKANQKYSFHCECNDNKYIVYVDNGIYNIRTIQESKYFLLRELLNIIDNDYVVDLEQCYTINGFFKNLDEADNYIRLKYNCLCDFCNTYLNIQPNEYRWNTFLTRVFKNSASVEIEVYYSYTWLNRKDINIRNTSNDLDWSKGLKNIISASIGHPSNFKINQEPLVVEIYEELIAIIFNEIDNLFDIDQ